MGSGRSNNRGGGIRHRSDGRWEGRVSVGGKMISVYGKTRKEVVNRLKETITLSDAGATKDIYNITVTEWMAEWYEIYIDSNDSYAPSTRVGYSKILNSYIYPYFKGVKLMDLNPLAIQKFIVWLQKDKHLSPKSTKNVFTLIHKAVKKTQSQYPIIRNLCDGVELPSIKRKEMKTLTPDEIKLFLRAIKGHRFENIFKVTLFCGLRESETLGLTWDCIDFDHSEILVKQQLQRPLDARTDRYYLKETKTKTARLLKAPDYVMAALKDEKRRQDHYKDILGEAFNNPMNLVFSNEFGRYLVHNIVYKGFKRIIKGLGIDIRVHDLRHTFATICLQSGDSIKVVQENLGHAQIETTLNIYSHVTDAMKEKSAANLQRFIDSVESNDSETGSKTGSNSNKNPRNP